MAIAEVIPQQQSERIRALLHDYAKFGVTGSLEIRFEQGAIQSVIASRREL